MAVHARRGCLESAGETLPRSLPISSLHPASRPSAVQAGRAGQRWSEFAAVHQLQPPATAPSPCWTLREAQAVRAGRGCLGFVAGRQRSLVTSTSPAWAFRARPSILCWSPEAADLQYRVCMRYKRCERLEIYLEEQGIFCSCLILDACSRPYISICMFA